MNIRRLNKAIKYFEDLDERRLQMNKWLYNYMNDDIPDIPLNLKQAKILTNRLKKDSHCGTVACFAGHQPVIFPSLWKPDYQDDTLYFTPSEEMCGEGPSRKIAYFYDIHINLAAALIIPDLYKSTFRSEKAALLIRLKAIRKMYYDKALPDPDGGQLGFRERQKLLVKYELKVTEEEL